MSRTDQPISYNLTEAARICGVSYPTIKRLWRDGKFPAVENPLTGLPRVTRLQLIRFLADHGYPDEILRPQLQPSSGHLFVVGAGKDIQWGRLVGCNPTFVRSLLTLGRRLVCEPCWGIVFDFAGLGREVALQAAIELRDSKDFPLTVAITHEDEPLRPTSSAGLFDLVLGRPIGAGNLLRSLIALRRSVVAREPRIADRRGRFRIVGKKGAKR